MNFSNLFENYWLLVVIAFAALSFFSKKKGESEDKGKGGANQPQTGMPPFGQKATRPQPQVHPTAGRPATLSNEPSAMTPEDNRFQPREQPEGRFEAITHQSSSVKGEIGENSPFSSKARSDRSGFDGGQATSVGSSSKHPLVQGIIWSEVLGPPRAHKPHRSQRK